MADKIMILGEIEAKIELLYPTQHWGKTKAHIGNNGNIFRIIPFPGRKALCIEYADNEKQAKKGIFPYDGDLFYLNEYSSTDEMLEDMKREIEN